jgi:hypothetical protein
LPRARSQLSCCRLWLNRLASREQAQAAPARTFDIPAQPLAQALTTLGQQARLQFAVTASVVAGKTSTPVAGAMTTEQALRLMLSGTGISYRFTSPTLVTITAAPDTSGVMVLDPVQVQGAFTVPPQAMIDNAPPAYAGGQVATGGQLGLLGNRAVWDTPFNQSNYTGQEGAGPAGQDRPRRADRRPVGSDHPRRQQPRHRPGEDPRLSRRQFGRLVWRPLWNAAERLDHGGNGRACGKC